MSSRLRKTVPPLCLAALVFLIYSPVLSTTYGCSDDYPELYAMTTPHRDGALGWEMQHQFALGRPICGLLMQASYGTAGTIAGLRLVRGAAVACLAVLAGCFLIVLRRVGWTRLESFALAGLMVTLPSFQVYASWAATAPHAFACLAALGAALLTEQAALRAHAVPWLLAAVLLETVALAIYQPAGTFYVVAAAVLLLPRSAPGSARASVLTHAAVLVGALGLGYLIFRVGVASFPAGVVESRASIDANVFAKLPWFLKHPLHDALNLHRLRPSHAVATVVVVFIGIGLIARLGRNFRALALTVLAVPISFLPNLLAPEPSLSYRTQAPLAGLLLFYLFTSLHALVGRASKFWNSFLVVVAVAAGLSAFHHARTLVAVPQRRELLAMQRVLRESPSIWSGNVDVRTSKRGDTIAPRMRYDEFGVPTTASWWNVEAMMRLIARDWRINDGAMRVRFLDEGEAPRPNAYYLDLRALMTQAAKEKP